MPSEFVFLAGLQPPEVTFVILTEFLFRFFHCGVGFVGRERLGYDTGANDIIRWMFENRVLQRFTYLVDGMVCISSFQFNENFCPLLRIYPVGSPLYKYQFITTLSFFHNIVVYGIYYRFLRTLRSCLNLFVQAIGRGFGGMARRFSKEDSRAI